MKQGKNPTVAQRKYIKHFRLNPEEFVIRNRLSDKEKRLPRRER